jgi:hypothetical protein
VVVHDGGEFWAGNFTFGCSGVRYTHLGSLGSLFLEKKWISMHTVHLNLFYRFCGSRDAGMGAWRCMKSDDVPCLDCSTILSELSYYLLYFV